MIGATRPGLLWRPSVVLAIVLAGVSPYARNGWTASPRGPAASRGPLAFIYVADAGVLVSSGATKVLIDALFDKPNPAYRVPSSAVLDKILRGAPPYDGVNLVLVTHDHPDHFDAGLAVRFLEANDKSRLPAPADAVDEMRRLASDWARIGSRVVSLDVPIGEKVRTDLGSASRSIRDLIRTRALWSLSSRHEPDPGVSTQ